MNNVICLFYILAAFVVSIATAVGNGQLMRKQNPVPSLKQEIIVDEHGDAHRLPSEPAIMEDLRARAENGEAVGSTAVQRVTTHSREVPVMTIQVVEEVLLKGVNCIVSSMTHFTASPPNVGAALALYQTDLWAIVDMLVPEEVKSDGVYTKAKAVWDGAFVAAADLTTKIDDFNKNGNQNSLVIGIASIIQDALDVAGTIWPQITYVFNAIDDILDAMGDAWQDFEKGDWSLGIDTIYKGVRAAVMELVPEDQQNTQTFDIVMGALDGTIGNLHKTVMSYKRKIAESSVCWRPGNIDREKYGRPDQCINGYEYDNIASCEPSKDNGKACFNACLKKSGMCSWCGSGKACCKRNDKTAPCECVGTMDYVDNPGQQGSPDDYHQCVPPGPCRQQGGACKPGSLLQNSEDAFQRDVIDSSLQRKGKPAASPYPQCVAFIEIKANEKEHKSRKEWIEKNINGATPSFAASLAVFANDQRVNSTSLDHTVSRKGPAEVEPVQGGMAATCAQGELKHSYCYKPCPSGYSVGTFTKCEYDCTAAGEFRARGPGLLCGKNEGDIVAKYMEITTMVIGTGITLFTLIKDFETHGANGDNIKKTIQAVIDVGKPFANPSCPAASLLEKSEKPALSVASFDGKFTKPTRNPYEVLAKAMEVFRHFDRDADGIIDSNEITQRLQSVAHVEVVSKAALTKLDTNGDGSIELHEWLAWATPKKKELLLGVSA